MVAVVVAPSLHGRRRSLRAADSRRGCVVVAPSSHRCHTSSRHRWSSCESSSGGLHHAAWGSPWSGGGGLRLESACGSGVGGGHRWGRWRSRYCLCTPATPSTPGTTLRARNPPHHHALPKSPWLPPPPLSSTQPVAAASNPSPRTSSPPPPPLTARKSRRNATATPPAAAGLQPLKDTTQPVVAASNPSPRTSSPPPPPLTARKSRCNTTATRRTTPTATTPMTTVTRQREQHRGRNDGDAAAGNSTEAGTTVTPARPTMMATAYQPKKEC
ncbi:hypothetical protein EDB85DRAFT_1889474 [Lactarius pseudohatsudake]|nr:hypothetical protein EDB85DRAFT_1889474 [Lactarius pseudohatsudake]